MAYHVNCSVGVHQIRAEERRNRGAAEEGGLQPGEEERGLHLLRCVPCNHYLKMGEGVGAARYSYRSPQP